MKVHETMPYMKSAFGADNKISDDTALSAKVFIQSQDDSFCCNDGNSCDEENADSRRLRRHQLFASATMKIANSSGPVIIGENKTCQTIPTNNFCISSTESTSSKRRKKGHRIYLSLEKDLEEDKTEWERNRSRPVVLHLLLLTSVFQPFSCRGPFRGTTNLCGPVSCRGPF